MAKAILKFNLDNHENFFYHKCCIKSLDMASVLFELSHNTRKRLEYLEYDGKLTSMAVMDIISELILDHNILIDEIVN